MGPNSRKMPVGPPPPSRTHEEADKILAAEPSREQRAIKTHFISGDKAYWGNKPRGGIGLTPFRANAIRYVSEYAALHEAYSYKEIGWINAFTVEQVPTKHSLGRISGTDGTGGRA